MSAQLVRHEYLASGKPYVTVECRECLVVLNSGYHYRPEHYHHAERLAAEHNAEEHS